VLFAVQAWYVLLVKLLVGHVVAACRAGFSPPRNERPAVDVRSLIESIESGERFAALGVTDPWCGEPFGWAVSAWSPALERALLQAISRIARYDPTEIMAHAAGGGDLLKPLYESLFPRAVRHALGEYYTPRWLAEHVLDQVGYCGQAAARLLDPTCGSGTFLLAALRRWRSQYSVLSTQYPVPIVGFDLHPLAVASARANYLLAIADLLGPDAQFDVPVFARDAILDQRPDAGTMSGTMYPWSWSCSASVDARALCGRRSLSCARRTVGHGDHADALSEQGGRRRLSPLPHRRRRPAAARLARGRPGRPSAVWRRGQLDERSHPTKRRAHDLSREVREVVAAKEG
jgi:hypothetical protein